MDNNITKRLTRDTSYTRPAKTYQDNLSNMEIKEKLKDYKKVSDIKKISIGTHIRYFTIDPKTNNKLFRLGGMLNKVDPNGLYVILSNGKLSWSVQIANTTFFQKMSEDEIKTEMKEDLKKEILQDTHDNKENEILKKEIKSLKKTNEQLVKQLALIEKEIKKQKK